MNDNTVSLTIAINGEEAKDELLALQQKAKQLSEAIYEAEQRGDNTLRDHLISDLDDVEDRLHSIQLETKQIVDVMPSLGKGLTFQDFKKISDMHTALPYFRTQNPLLKKFHGLNFYDLGMEFSKLYDFYSSMNDETRANHEFKMRNGEILSFTDKTELRKLLDDFISAMSSLRNSLSWMVSNGFATKKKDPGNRLEINDEFEQAKAEHLILFVQGKLNQLELAIADLKSERIRNDKLLGTDAHLTENERHNLTMRNLEIEKQIAIKNGKLLANENSVLLEEEKNKKRDELFASYQFELEKLKELYDNGYLSLKVFNQKERTLRIDLYSNLLNYLKKNSFSYYETQRKLNDLLKQQVLENIKNIENYIKSLSSKYFGLSNQSNGSSLKIGRYSFDLRSREEIQTSYEQSIAALEILRKRLISTSNGDENKITTINKHVNHAKRWEEINYKRSIGEDPGLNWKEKLEDFNNWFQDEEASKIFNIANNISSNIGAIFSSLGDLAKDELEYRLAELNRYYDREISLAEGNGRKVKHLERKRDREIAKARNESQKKQLNFQLFNAIAQNAQNIISAYGAGLQAPWPTSMWLAPAMAGLAAAAGLVQIAVISKQQSLVNSQGYKKGGFTESGPENKVVGVVHAGEWVASKHLVEDPYYRPAIEMLERAQHSNYVPKFTKDYVDKNLDRQHPAYGSDLFMAYAQQEERNQLLNMRLQLCIDRLTERLKEPFVTVNTVTGDAGIKEAQDEYLRLMNNTLPKSKRKKL